VDAFCVAPKGLATVAAEAGAGVWGATVAERTFAVTLGDPAVLVEGEEVAATVLDAATACVATAGAFAETFWFASVAFAVALAVAAAAGAEAGLDAGATFTLTEDG